MFGNMGRARQNAQVGKVIVGLVPVLVMDYFTGTESAAKMDFHDVPMFKYLPSVDRNDPITSGSHAAFAIGSLLAKQRVAVAENSKVVGITVASPLDQVSAVLDGAQIGRLMFCESPRNGVFPHSRNHGLSSRGHWITRTGTVVTKRVNSGKPRPRNGEGNPERSRGYSFGTCNDYRRGLAPLMTGKSARPEREEIV